MWLRECSVHQSVTDTDLSLINFASLLQDVQLNRFIYILSPTIAALVSDTKEPKVGTKPSREGEKFREGAELVKNTQRVEEWKLRRGESWTTVFRNKTIEGPLLQAKCHPCLKYHVRGSCYADCRNKASHCQLRGEDKNKVNQFIKSLRGE